MTVSLAIRHYCLTYSLWLFGLDVMTLLPILLSEINFLTINSISLVQTEGRITLLNGKGKSPVNCKRSAVTLFYLNIILNGKDDKDFSPTI